jgi:ferredoxin
MQKSGENILVLDYDGLGRASVDACHAQDAFIHARWARLLLSVDFDHVVDVHGADLGADTSALTNIEINDDSRQIQFHLFLYYLFSSCLNVFEHCRLLRIMGKYHVEVDRTICQGFGACVELCPNGFILSDRDGKTLLQGGKEEMDGGKSVKSSIEVDDLNCYGQAEATCPFKAIRVIEL